MRFAQRGDASDGTGSLDLLDAEGMRAAAPAVYERFRTGCPGAVVRDGSWWDRTLGLVDDPGTESPSFRQHVLYSGVDGTPEGYLSYHVDWEGEWHFSRAVLTVDHLCTLTPQAYARLWRYCCEADLVRAVQAPARPVEEALPWLLTDARAVRLTRRVDQLWARYSTPPPRWPAAATSPRPESWSRSSIRRATPPGVTPSTAGPTARVASRPAPRQTSR